MMAEASALESYLAEHRDRRMAAYMDFLRIPSISTLPANRADCHAAAEWLAAELTRAGVEHVSVNETGRHPIVYGDWLHAEGAPTVIVYGHYDVQPVDPLDLWESPPFEPIVKGHRIQGRGAADDKGQIMVHVRAAEAILATAGGLPLNLKFVFEGEEESSSEHLDAWLEENRERLRADLAVISDTGFFDGNLPAITVGLRGLSACQIDVFGPSGDLHSGSYGGTVENPISALAGILAALKGPDGRIRVPGFYDDVRPLTEADRAALAALPFDEAGYLVGTGSPELVGEAGFTTLERRGARPTLEINGVWGGFQGEGTKTIIPAHAHAKITCRLVADQRPEPVFERIRAYVAEIAPPTVRVEVRYLGGGLPSLTPIDHPATQAAARAIRATFGAEPLYIRAGGSIPVGASFEGILGLPVVLVGFTPPDDHAHAPNEWMDLRNFETAIRTIVRLWDELATLPR
ncbi:MAG TPA: dipeptidase [Candidatus Saccharimonadales bacterium]|nr:dipeptidase [Candidatus Saccharimonadales bacterium]